MSMATHITVRVPMTIRRRPGRKTVVTPMALAGVPAVPTRADPALLKALARAFRYLASWFAMAGAVYFFLGIETQGRSIEEIDRELKRSPASAA